MSWFDPSGIAVLAKQALKEAQKSIDKALDIKDDELLPVQSLPDLTGGGTTQTPRAATTTTAATSMKQSISNPALPASIWGSFTGSFFDNPNSTDGDSGTVTTPPAARPKSDSKDSQHHLLSESSSSVEIVSPPTSPGSSLQSPDQASTIQCSESIEVISNLTSPSSDLITVSSSVSADFDTSTNQNNIDPVDELLQDDAYDEDSKSYKTVSEATVIQPNRIGLHLPLANETCATTSTIPNKETIPRQLEDASQEKLVVETLEEEQTRMSDSTQSFEYVNQADGTAAERRRGDSPHSSEGDCLKVISQPTSGHTSADEVETATSSDIEIISSPNGDSSSTNSAYKVSPAMCSADGNAVSSAAAAMSKKKGHCRESSAHSIQSTASDDSRFSVSETELLLRRISELTEVLESREYKLMELGREHAELFERNSEMKQQLEAKRKRDDCLEVTTVTEEYTQRLSALEKKFQQSIRDRDNLREQLKVARTELLTKVSRDDMETAMREKEFLCEELQREGEKLSKQILQHSTIIKKLRAKEKENDTTVKRQKEQLDECIEELDRLKKSLSAKDDVERTQIEAVHNLSAEKRKLEKEAAQLRSQLDDTTQRLKTIQTSFDAAKREINDRQQTQAELSRKTTALASIESENMLAKNQNQQMATELANLRERLRQVEGGTSQKEQQLRQENSKLLRRLEDAEQNLEQQAQSVTDATIPLVRQLDALQSTLNLRTSAWETQEKTLLEKLASTQSKLQRANVSEQQGKDNDATMTAKIIQLEERLSVALLKSEQTSSALQQRVVEFELSETDFKTKLDALKNTIRQHTITIEDGQQKIIELQKQLDVAEQKQRKHQEFIEVTSTKSSSTLLDNEPEVIGQANESPTPSLGHASMADSLSSAMWQFVSVFFFFLLIILK